MSERTGYDQGVPCWVDLMALDRGRATAFYEGLLGWQAADPSGAGLGFWEPAAHRGAQVVNETGALCWNELTTRDPEAAQAFFADVLGWSMAPNSDDPADEYRIISVGDRGVAGVMPMTGDMWPADLPAHWMVYFAVDGTDEAAARAEHLGGTISVPPFDVPVGRISVLNDPDGAVFSVITPAEGSGFDG